MKNSYPVVNNILEVEVEVEGRNDFSLDDWGTVLV
jgi:hypothetical protein